MKIASKAAPAVPDLNALPEHALLTEQQLHALTGFATITFRVWRSKGLGPKVTRINGDLPRYLARDVRAWIEGAA